MAVSAKALYGAGAAFAAGVIATLAVVNLSGGEPSDPSQVAKPAAQPSPPAVDRHAWSDPVRSHSSSAASAPRESRPPLTFKLADSGRHSGPGQPQAAYTDKQEEVTPPAAQPGGSEGKAARRTKTAQLREGERDSERANRKELQVPQALSEKPRSKPVIVPQTSKEPPAITNEAVSANLRSRATTELGETGTRRRVAADRDTRRQEAKVPLNSTRDRHSLAAAREVRRILPVRVTRHADAQLDEDAPQSLRRRHGPSTEALGPTQHYSSAGTGGVMGWLME